MPRRSLRHIAPCHPRLGLTSKTKKCFPGHVRRRLKTRRRKGGCKNHSSERCLLQQADIPEREKEQLARQYLRPARPSAWASDPDQWLDSNNIADVMKQYEEAYHDFKFLGVLPIDFAAPDPYKDGLSCLVDQICDLDLAAFKRGGIWRLAVVFNLDPHFKDGSHWVAAFVDLRAKKVYYFDSYGMKPPEQIAKFMRSLTIQEPLELEYNARRFQYQGSECGMYSMYFIAVMLEGGGSFKEFCHHSVPDKEMLQLRHQFFS